MLIITGTGRCGTMWLAKCFHAHHEYHAAKMERVWPKFKIQGSETFNDYPKRLQFMKTHLSDVGNQMDFKDSSNLYVHFLDALYEIEPTLKVILIVRDFEPFERSALKRMWHTYLGYHRCPVDGWGKMDAHQRMRWVYDFRINKAKERMAVLPENQRIICRLEDVARDITPLEEFVGVKANKEWTGRVANRGRK